MSAPTQEVTAHSTEGYTHDSPMTSPSSRACCNTLLAREPTHASTSCTPCADNSRCRRSSISTAAESMVVTGVMSSTRKRARGSVGSTSCSGRSAALPMASSVSRSYRKVTFAK
eukprot:1373719-Prymnesium_polylepis.1